MSARLTFEVSVKEGAKGVIFRPSQINEERVWMTLSQCRAQLGMRNAVEIRSRLEESHKNECTPNI